MDENMMQEDEKFSDDPKENMDMENQFLKMKLMAETGARFYEGESGLPPEIMNQWLKNIAQFEEEYANAKQKALREILGFPDFRPSSELNENEFGETFDNLQQTLKKSGVEVSFLRERDDRFKYDFITGELLDHETTLFPGMVTTFIYEEFYPDHELDIRNRTKEFFNAFFERRLGVSDSPYFDDDFIFPDGRIVTSNEMMQRFQSMYDAVPEFENTFYSIEKIDFELKKNPESGDETGMGYSEGTVAYELIFSNGDRKPIEGPFKIYFHMRHGWWDIFFFYLSGFNLHKKKDDPDK